MKGIDYDIIIIGGTATARYAAAKAAQTQARTALIEPSPPLSNALHRQALAHAAQVAHQMRHADLWGFPSTTPLLQWQTLTEWTHRVAETLNPEHSIESLAAAGVDVVVGQGTFIRHPQGLEINGRLLRSRTYLLAPVTQPAIPAFAPTIDYLTPDSLIHQPWQSLPPRLIICSNEPAGIELAQSANRLGTQVTLITEQAQLLKQADPVLINELRSQLEAEGVTIFTNFQITQIEQQENLKRVWSEDKIIEAEELLIAMGRRSPLEHLNLEAIDVQWQPQGIPVNRYLQTSNLQVYACGETLGGYAIPHLAEYEADIAVNNALSFQKIQTDYQWIPWGTLTQPEFVQVGLTAAQARKRYKAVKVLSQQMPNHRGITNEAAGLCQVVVRRNGDILGAQMIGTGAHEAIGAIALAMRSKLKVKARASRCPQGVAQLLSG
ncbi:MAG: NAD(P)/FAD-dependent oxidoreductase [Leptolyngbyaceae cyanobacterium CSU_1_4]|nr:NAD(P)/FAD-dependent oxidoreductase [Leptolyngbyaceae cyanobacterium CSU_1_4]